MHKAKHRALPAALAATLGLLPAAVAGPVRSVRVTTYAEFAEGEDQGVLLTAQGEARAGIRTTRLPLPALTDDSVRASARAPDGTVYLGTGGEGPSVLVYAKGQLRRLARLDGSTWVTALCLLDGPGRPDGHVLAATAQDGRLFAITPDGKAQVVAQVEGEHVWALQRDAQRGVTYVATGPGRLWAIDDKAIDAARGGGKEPIKTPVRKLWDSGARQLLALDLVPASGKTPAALYVGTADDAVLYRVDPETGAARALHDFAGNEVRALAHQSGPQGTALFVAVNDMQRGDTASHGVKLAPAAAGTVPGVKATPPPTAPAPPNQALVEKKGKGGLFRIDPEGRVEQLHAIVDGFFNDLAVDPGGDVYAAASAPAGRGRVYLARPDRSVLAALEFKESDALTLSLGAPGTPRLVGTGNSGALYVLGDEPPRDAAYLSKVFDAQAPARWGTLRFSGDGPLRVETRTGNLARPDGAWSPWQPLAQLARISATGEQSGKVASPGGRYLQVRTLVGAQAVLRDFTVYYQPQNQRPYLTDVLIGEDPQGRVARGVKQTSVLRPRSPLVKLRWKVQNTDEDDLWYRVYLRPAAGSQAAPAAGGTGTPASPAASAASAALGTLGTTEPGWLRLGGPDPLTRTELDWNTETVADGLYELKVVVSDERSNPPELALAHELLSPPFLVDNRRPDLRELRWDAATGTLRGQAVDALSAIGELAYAIDGGDLLPIAPADGLLDDLTEDFSVRPPRLSPGPHTLVVRASDAADNVSTVQLVIQAK